MTSKRDVIERIGGLDRMREVLRDFYDQLFDDMLVGFFFQGRDKKKLIERQLQFTARAFGAEIVYEGKSMPDAHGPLPPILPGHFDRRHRLLEEALRRHALPEDAIEVWLAYDKSFRRAVLGAKAGLKKPA
ncbi:MAG: group 1 truncated hemoglobin [Sandaracinaceae bacterium]|nr:group 1 truncated hemoglobin [Sandaracinaceae bacterium]